MSCRLEKWLSPRQQLEAGRESSSLAVPSGCSAWLPVLLIKAEEHVGADPSDQPSAPAGWHEAGQLREAEKHRMGTEELAPLLGHLQSCSGAEERYR